MAGWKHKLRREVTHQRADKAFWVFFILGSLLVVAAFLGKFYPDVIAGVIIIAIGLYKIGELIHVEEELEARHRIRSSIHRISDTVEEMKLSVDSTGKELSDHIRESFYRLQSVGKKLDEGMASQNRKIKLARGYAKRVGSQSKKELERLGMEFEAAKGDIESAKIGYLELMRKVKLADELAKGLKTEFEGRYEKVERQAARNFRDLARKIIEIENKLGNIRKALG